MRPLTVGLVLTITLSAFSALAVETILPIISDELGGVSLYGWVFSAFFLGSLVAVIVAGGMADERGTLVPYAVGLGLFALGLAIAGAAPSMGVLVGARLIQGFGSGAVISATYASIARGYTETEHPRMFAILSTAWVLPAILGPAAAAFIATSTSWRIVFAGLLPFAVVAAVLTLPALRELGAPPTPGRRTSRRDAVLVAVGFGLILAGLTSTAVMLAVALIAAGAAVGVPALWRVTPAGTLTGRTGLGAAVLVRGLITFAFFGTEAFLPLMLREARGLSPTIAGVVLSTGALTWTGGSWVHERLAPRLTSRAIIATAFALVATGAGGVLAVLLFPLPVEIAYVGWAVSGAGIGFGYSAISVLVLRLAPADVRDPLDGVGAARDPRTGRGRVHRDVHQLAARLRRTPAVRGRRRAADRAGAPRARQAGDSRPADEPSRRRARRGRLRAHPRGPDQHRRRAGHRVDRRGGSRRRARPPARDAIRHAHGPDRPRRGR
ncbi:MAG: hypothetical protein QOH08_92, partial [Chloroflexota bacterium]|nr:hypothetical protein [Chloroflexota bacterium]